MENIIGLKELRLNMAKYASRVKTGQSFIVIKKNKPLFRIMPLEKENSWEEAVDFTKIKKGGVDIDEVLARL